MTTANNKLATLTTDILAQVGTYRCEALWVKFDELMLAELGTAGFNAFEVKIHSTVKSDGSGTYSAADVLRLASDALTNA